MISREVPSQILFNVATVAMAVGITTVVQRSGGKHAPYITFAGGLAGLVALEYMRRGSTVPTPMSPDNAEPGY